MKILNGAHSTIGKIISKICSQTITAQQKSNTNASTAKSQAFEYKSISDELKTRSLDVKWENEENDELEENSSRRADSDRLLPLDKPFKREYILRSSVPRPAPYSRQSPQRLYCLMSNIEFRLAGAFTEDTMFF